MTLELHLRIVGVLLFVLIAANAIAARRYWREPVGRLELFPRQVFWVHLFFIVVVLALMGTLCLAFPHLLAAPGPLPKLVLGGLAIFWGLRLLTQLFVYDPRIWRGKRFETAMHAAFTGLWAYFAGVFSVAWCAQP